MAYIPGINQVQVNEKVGDIATALRSILRQDPDVIIIGEIRDQETAEIAVKASITGHLVASTIHTNSAAGTVTRMTVWVWSLTIVRITGRYHSPAVGQKAVSGL